MHNSLFYGLALLSFNYNCTPVNSQEMATQAKAQDSVYVGPTHFSDDLVRDDALYITTIRVDKRQGTEYVLSIQMNLKKDAYFISPNAKRAFSGKFTLVLPDSSKIATNGAILETPLSKEEHHKGEGLVNYVRNNTHYKQTLKVLSDEDFEARGHVQFTIEPRCTMEKVPFVLSHKDGKLTVRMDGC